MYSLPVVQLLCGFMAYHYTSVVQGVAIIIMLTSNTERALANTIAHSNALLVRDMHSNDHEQHYGYC